MNERNAFVAVGNKVQNQGEAPADVNEDLQEVCWVLWLHALLEVESRANDNLGVDPNIPDEACFQVQDLLLLPLRQDLLDFLP